MTALATAPRSSGSRAAVDELQLVVLELGEADAAARVATAG